LFQLFLQFICECDGEGKLLKFAENVAKALPQWKRYRFYIWQ